MVHQHPVSIYVLVQQPELALAGQAASILKLHRALQLPACSCILQAALAHRAGMSSCTQALKCSTVLAGAHSLMMAAVNFAQVAQVHLKCHAHLWHL